MFVQATQREQIEALVDDPAYLNKLKERTKALLRGEEVEAPQEKIVFIDREGNRKVLSQ